MALDKNKIRVWNYQPSCVIVSTRNRNLRIAPCEDDRPVGEYFTLEELEYMNDNSPVFRSGMLEFSDNEREELCGHLRIDADKCLYERDIDAMLLKADQDALTKIIAINDAQNIGRVRGHLARLSAYVPARVSDVVNRRYNEIRSGQRKSKVAAEQALQQKEDVRDQQIAAMREEMETMRQMLAQFMQGAVRETVVSDTPNADNMGEFIHEPVTEEPKRKGGRPRKGAATE